MAGRPSLFYGFRSISWRARHDFTGFSCPSSPLVDLKPRFLSRRSMRSTYGKETPAKTFPSVPQLDLRANLSVKFRRPEADSAPDRFGHGRNCGKTAFCIDVEANAASFSPINGIFPDTIALRPMPEATIPQLRPSRDTVTTISEAFGRLIPLPGGPRGCRPWGQREARGINTGICTKKGHRRQSMTFFRGDSRIRTGDPLLAKQVLYQLSYTPEVVPGRR